MQATPILSVDGPNPRLPAVIPWAVAFSAIVAHMPALAGYFVLDDWVFLARGAQLLPSPAWSARAVSAVGYWKLTWPAFGLNSAAYHGVGLTLAVALAVLTARVGFRLGLRPAGAAVAGLVVAATPIVVTPIFWVSATGELLAAAFALLALDLWLSPGIWRRAVATVLVVAAVMCGETPLPLFILLPLGVRWVRRESLSPGLWIATLIMAAASATELVLLLRAADLAVLPTASGFVAGMGKLGGWLLSPWRLANTEFAGPRAIGLMLWIVWSAMAVVRARSGQRLIGYAVLWATLTTVAPFLVGGTATTNMLTLAVVGWAWTLGALVAPLIESWRDRLPTTQSIRLPVFVLVLGAIVVTSVGWSATRDRLTRRDEDGFLRDPLMRKMSIATEAARTLRAQPFEFRSTCAILQASSMQMPENVNLPEGAQVYFQSPIFEALAGLTGLQMLMPETVEGRWVHNLDDLEAKDLVFLDVGDAFLRMVGRPSNARLYSALIAVSGGQFERAQHDLWNVAGPQGAIVPFTLRQENLPIPVVDFDREALHFVDFLAVQSTPAARRVEKLFRDLYETVRDQPLTSDVVDEPEQPWGAMPRSRG